MSDVLVILFITAGIGVLSFGAMILLGGLMTLFEEVCYWLKGRNR